MKTARKKRDKVTKGIWFINMLMCVLLLAGSSKSIFANNIFEDPQTIQYDQVQYSDNGLLDNLITVDDEHFDIAEVSLLLAKDEYSGIKVEDYVECVDWYARMIKVRIADGDGPKWIINIINKFLFDELGFIYVPTGNLEDLYLNKVIDRRKGNCVGLSILYLSIAERLGLPLFGVNVPEHIFVRYDDGKQKINIETGHKGMSLPNTFYVKHSVEQFDEESVTHGCYLQNLDNKEVISNILLNRSKIRREDGDHRGALGDCKKSILLNPKNPAAYCNRGVVYEKMGLIAEAIKDYSMAISLNSKYASAYYNRGSLLGVVGKYGKAIEDFNVAITVNPKFTLFYLNRAIAFKKIGKVDKAIQDYNAIIEIDPDYAQAYCNRGVAFAETGRFDDAMNDLNKAIELDPYLSDAYFSRAIFFADNNNLKEAIEDFGKCISLTPDKIFTYYLRGKMYKETGEFEKAIQDFSKAIAVRPSMAGLYIDRGVLLLQTGRFDEAITDFDKSLELFPGNPVAFRYRGESFREKGQYEKAIDDLEMFLKIAPGAPNANIIRNEIEELKIDFILN
ncbi:MAG: tetratricopeptide repeat protein [Candidatus Scalindua sp.]|jgi:tetratricopeptide (TPR) repeat protein|nr:tetratricopeptide repeat protein [Candidatus Scalindua sp.]MBT5305847.1 tetratricopeptide repeat protein [Candidatus Scalindua sp.]MBT6045717.1 tetratricopeptide repeat protein [Candidatus Scalindua sp.]MBT6227364.1 tetratricopeptide repeat protein [Candidatus Scalindua sp.]MBT6563688.1 tetratricopeptide repeat protein [Candidatus Scalindua sp.]